jgi:hypothetical protein
MTITNTILHTLTLSIMANNIITSSIRTLSVKDTEHK